MRSIWVFIFANLALTCFFLDTRYTPNPMSRALPVLTLYEEGTLRIDKYERWSNDKAKIGEHYYSDKAPLPTFIVIPFYGLLKLVGLDKVDTNRKFVAYPVSILGDILCGSVPLVAIMLLTLLAIRGAPGLSLPAPLLATLPYYASFLFVYSGTFFNHLISAALLLGCYVLLKEGRRFALAGFFAGAAVLCEYPVALAIPVFAVQIYVNSGRNACVRFLLGAAPWGLGGGAYNLAITGSAFKTVNAFHADPQFAGMRSNYGFRLPSLEALWGLTLSPYRGMLYYAPFLSLGIYGVYKHRRSLSLKRALRHYLVPLSLLFFFVFTAHFTWWGGWCYGPRYLTPVVLLLLYETVLFLARQKVSRAVFWALFAFGFIQAVLAKLTVVYLAGESFSFPIAQLIIPELLAGKLNQDNALTMLLGLHPLASVALWLAAFVTYFAAYRPLNPAKRKG